MALHINVSPRAMYRTSFQLKHQQRNISTHASIHCTQKPRLHNTTCCQTRLTTGLTTGCIV